MNNNYVGFPNLNLSFNIDPVAFTILGKDIYWYGLIIASGLILAAILCTYLAKRENLPKDTILDIVLFATPVSIIFARIYYVIFSFDSYKDNLLSVFKIWEGGIAIYGAIIGAVLTAYIYCKIKKISFLKTADVAIIGVLLGQAIGRWGNFVNKEAYGRITDSFFKMEIYSGFNLISVHPTFLYESLWNFIGVLVLLFVNKKKRNYGETFYSYLVWYGLGRFFIESLRTDSLYLGMFRISQLVSAILVVLGTVLLIVTRKKSQQS